MNEPGTFVVQVANGGPADLDDLSALITVFGDALLVDAASSEMDCSVISQSRTATCVPVGGAAEAGFAANVNVRVQALSSGTVNLRAETPVPPGGDPDESNNTAQASADAVVLPADTSVTVLDVPVAPFVVNVPGSFVVRVANDGPAGLDDLPVAVQGGR